MMGILSTPRPVPNRRWSIAAGAGVIMAALPVTLAAGAPTAGWVLAAVLWVVGELAAAFLARVPIGADSVVTSGMRGVGMTFRVIAIMVVLLAVTAANESVGVTATLVFVAAYTLELIVSLSTYFGTAG
jgi:hypothetical protein